MSSESSKDPKAKYREALEKKKVGKSHSGIGKSSASKIRDSQSGAGAPKMFRRKSGSN
jgi:hypothetical protein